MPIPAPTANSASSPASRSAQAMGARTYASTASSMRAASGISLICIAILLAHVGRDRLMPLLLCPLLEQIDDALTHAQAVPVALLFEAVPHLWGHADMDVEFVEVAHSATLSDVDLI